MKRQLRRRRHLLFGVLLVAALIVASSILGLSFGRWYWFSSAVADPAVAYTPDANVHLTATLTSWMHSVGGIEVRFLAAGSSTQPPYALGNTTTNVQGVASITFIPGGAPYVVRIIAVFTIPGTSTNVASPPVTLEVFLPPTLVSSHIVAPTIDP